MESGTEGLRLLSLDGGGIRGLSELLILEEIMYRIKAEKGLAVVPKPCECFDIIGGTSTGGLIAILLGRLCLSVEEAIGAYNEFAGRVFSETKRAWQDGTFKASVFEAAVKEIVARYDESGDENALMMSDVSNGRTCKTFVCAVAALNASHPRLFRSYEASSNQSHNSTIWEAARATSAAPTLFKRISIGADPKEEFIDGGLRCNNPTAVVLREAQDIYGTDCAISCIVSIGTGHPRTITLRKPDRFQRLLPTDMVRVLVGISTDCESLSDEFERTRGEGGAGMKTYFRFNVQQGLQDVSLAEWTRLGEVKTHTLQYLRGAAVGMEIDKVRDLLRVRSADGHAEGIVPSHADHVSQQTLLVEKQEQVTASLGVIFDTVTHYKRLVSCNGDDAQKILDAFQTLLDTETFRNRSQLIAAMRRLSSRTNLYPTRFFLKGPIPSLRNEQPVAAGSFADVYRVAFRGEDTCFKAIRLYQRSQVEHIAKVYARESIVWAQLSHPHILPFYGLVRLESRLAFVSRWAENGNLGDYLACTPDANRLVLCSDTAAGVEYLHRNDIVHGDLKSMNVLIDGSGRAALGDFGLSSVSDPLILKWSTQSTVASRGGTVRWQAPELLVSEDTAEKVHNTKASDVFAWAGVCYEIFTNRVPYYEHPQPASVMLSILRGETPSRPGAADAAWVTHGLTEGVWGIMRECWAFEALERPGMGVVVGRLGGGGAVDGRGWEGGAGRRLRIQNARDVGRVEFWEGLEGLIGRVVWDGKQ